MSGLILAIDVGTSGARAVVFDAQANYLWHVRKPYPMLYPHPGWNEQDPHIVTNAVIEALKEAVFRLPAAESLEAVVFSSQMYSILALDKNGTPLSNSLTWGDSRSTGLAEMSRRAASPELPRRTGCPVQPIYPLAKIRWLKAHLDLPTEVKFVSIKDYVLFCLTGELVADWSSASASGLLDITTRCWDDEALGLCQITTDNLPPLVSPRQIMRRWKPEISAYIGIAPTTPLIVGAGDAPLASIGVGAVDPGSLAINIGTSAAARVLTNQAQSDASGRLWTYVADVDHWVVGGIIGSGGAVYEWLLTDLLSSTLNTPGESLFQSADRLAAEVSAGAEDLFFLPYFTGEQSPGWNAQTRGLVYGMTFRHVPAHFIRAAIEGITFSLLRAAQPIEEVRQLPTQKIYLTGGLSVSPVWSRIIADVFGASVVIPRSSESSARGAAILGWLTLGAADSYRSFSQPEELLSPDSETQTFYQQHYQKFCSLHHHLQAYLADQEIEP